MKTVTTFGCFVEIAPGKEVSAYVTLIFNRALPAMCSVLSFKMHCLCSSVVFNFGTL